MIISEPVYSSSGGWVVSLLLMAFSCWRICINPMTWRGGDFPETVVYVVGFSKSSHMTAKDTSEQLTQFKTSEVGWWLLFDISESYKTIWGREEPNYKKPWLSSLSKSSNLCGCAWVVDVCSQWQGALPSLCTLYCWNQEIVLYGSYEQKRSVLDRLYLGHYFIYHFTSFSFEPTHWSSWLDPTMGYYSYVGRSPEFHCSRISRRPNVILIS